MIRLLRTGFYFVSASILMLCMVLALLLYSSKFNHWLVLTVAPLVPGLSIDEMDGLLLSELHLQGIKYQMEQVDISINSASYRLSLDDIVSRRLQVDYMHLNGINIVLLEETKPEEPDSETDAFVMPLKIQADDFVLNGMQIKQNEEIYVVEHVHMAFNYQGQQLQFSDLAVQSDRGNLQGDIALQLDSQLPFTADLSLDRLEPDFGEIKAHMALSGDSQKINLDADLLAPAKVHAQGWVDLAHSAPVFTLQMNWPILQWPLQGVRQYASENAQFSLQGNIDNYTLALDSDIIAQGFAPGKLHFIGQGDSEQLTLEALSLQAFAGKIQSSGRFSWTDKIPSQLNLLANKVQLPADLMGYPAELNLDAQVTGRLLGEPDFRLKLIDLHGKLAEAPVNAQANIHYTPRQLMLEQLRVYIGENNLQAQGTIGRKNSVKFKLSAANLYQVDSDLRGSVYAQGLVSGSKNKPLVEVDLKAAGLKYQEQSLQHLEAKGSLASEGEGRLDLNLKAEQLIFNKTVIDSIEVQSIGQYAHHELRAQVKSKRGSGELAMQGSWDSTAQQWQGNIRQLHFLTPFEGNWQLIKAAPFSFKLAQPIGVETDFCLSQLSGTGLVCLLAETKKQAGQILQAEIKQIPLSVLKGWLPDNMQIETHLQATISLKTKPAVEGDINIALDPGAIKINHEHSGIQRISFASAAIDAQLKAGKLQSNLALVLNDANKVQGELKVKGLEQLKTAQLDGLLDIQMQKIGLLAAFSDAISEVSGEVYAQLVVQGTLSRPKLKGSHAQLTKGQLFIPELGLQVDHINAELKHLRGEKIALQAKASIAEQQIKVDGQLSQYFSGDLNYQVTVKGESLQLMQTPEIQAWVSPNLLLKGDKQGGKLAGQVDIPKAILVVKSLPEGAVAVSEDEIDVTVDKSVVKAPVYPLDMDIKINLGDSVSVDGFGLKTNLQGQLRAVQKNNQLKLFNELNSAKGTYRAYGQDLKIEKGQLLFTGELDNPGVNILASRKAADWNDKTVAYLRMSGTLKKPVTTVYTVPAKSESDALAYLLTGAPMGKSNSSSSALLAAAAMSLGRDYVDALMGVVGVDEFDMKSTSLGQNSMVIGKRISTDLYARYIMDVLTAQMQFALIYKLTKNISIETRAGSTYSSDIKYNIEFD